MSREQRLQALIEETERELAAAEQAAKAMQETSVTTLAAVAADAAEGIITAEEAASRRAATSRDLDAAREQADTLSRALPELRNRLSQEDEQQRLRAIEKARDAHRRAQQASLLAAKALGKELQQAASAARELQRHRALVADAAGALAALLTAADRPIALIDEPAFCDGATELIDLLNAGPATPLADAAREHDRAAASRAKRDEQVLGWFRRHASRQTIAQLEPHLHERARRILDEVEVERQATRERIQAAEKAREFERV